MTALPLLTALPAAIGLYVLGRGTIWHLRARCSYDMAERYAVAGALVTFGLLESAAATLSPWLMLAGLATMTAANSVRLLLRVSGGSDPVCRLRREIHQLFGMMLNRTTLDDATVRQMRRRLADLEQYRTSETGRVLESIQRALGMVLRGDPDRAGIQRAYDEIDASIAALKAQHPW